MENKKEEYDSKKLTAGIKLFIYVVLIMSVIIFGMNARNNIEEKEEIVFNVSILDSLKENNYICNINGKKDEEDLSLLVYKNSLISQFIKKSDEEYYIMRDGESYLLDTSNLENINEDSLIKKDSSDIYLNFDDFFLNINQVINIINNVNYQQKYEDFKFVLTFNTCDVINYYNETYFTSYICNENSSISFEILLIDDSIKILTNVTSFYNILDKKEYNNYSYNMSYSNIGKVKENDYLTLLENNQQ